MLFKLIRDRNAVQPYMKQAAQSWTSPRELDGQEPRANGRINYRDIYLPSVFS